MSPEPPRRDEGVLRRPWYLVVALLLCSLLGAYGSLDGFDTINVYRTTQIDSSYIARDITQEDNRKAVAASFDQLLGAMEHEKARLFPLAAAEVVLGMALFMLSVFALLGRGGARVAVVQIVIAQAALVGAMHFATPKVRAAYADLRLTVDSSEMLEKGKDPAMVAEVVKAARRIEPYAAIFRLGLRSALAILVLVALTRPRARAFYEARNNERPNEG